MNSNTFVRPFLAAAAFGFGGLVLPAASGLAATETSPPGSCTQPIFAATVDPAGSTPMSPRVELFWEGLATPAQQHLERGDGEYESAAINRGHGPTSPIVSRPHYEQPGMYDLTATVTDACGATVSGSVQLTVPMALPALTPTVACPGTLDRSGYCIVPTGDVPLEVQDPAGGTVWTWNVFLTGGIGATATQSSPAARLEPGSVLLVQGTAPSDAGWLVTSPMRFVALAAQPPRIEELIAPRSVAGDSPVTIGFTVPAGAELAAPSIAIDAQSPIPGSTAEVQFAPGTHTVTFALLFRDGSVVQRQAIVVASAPVSRAALAAAGLAAVAASVLILLLIRTARRRRAIAIAAPQSRSSS